MRNVIRNVIPTGARYALGLIFFVFGLNGFLHFIPQPAPSGELAVFVGGLAAGGWFFPLLKGTEVLAGALLLANRHVPLALAVLAPIVVNIVALHVFLAPAGLPIAVVTLGLLLVLAWTYRAAYAPMLRRHVAPVAATVAADDSRPAPGRPAEIRPRAA